METLLRMFTRKRLVVLLICVGIVMLAGGWYVYHNRGPDVLLRTAAVTRGDLVATIGSSGTCEPQEVVDVGAQIAGLLDTFGQDPDTPGKTIDYGSKVKEGELLAHIDDSLYVAAVDNAQAAMDQAKANVVRAQADILQMRAKLDEAQNDWTRAQKIGPGDALAETDYDQYKATFETAKANVAVDEASIVQAQQAVIGAEASLRSAQKTLGYCTITSPVDGVVIDRRVNIGETVVASLNAPSLFLIAKDLTKMQVWAPVNEADIGSIHPGQRVTFTVDAYPDQIFVGSVGKVRLNATMTQNVVTYTVEVNTDNSDSKLLPYLTANLHFEVASEKDVLMVPNAAVRWSPPQQDMIAPDVRAEMGKSASAGPGSGGMGSGSEAGGGAGQGAAGGGEQHGPTTQGSGHWHRGGGNGSGGGRHATTRGTVWVRDGQYVRPISVRVGITDGTLTKIDSPDIKEGMEVIVADYQPSDVASGPQTNPFAPQFGRGPGGGGGGQRRQ